MNFNNTYLLFVVLMPLGGQGLASNVAAAGNPAEAATKETQQAITPSNCV